MARQRKHDGAIRELADKGLKGKEIAKVLDLHPQTVWESLRLSEDENKKIASFNKDLPNHLTRLIGKITRELANKDISNVSPYQLVTMAAILIDKQRLLSGQSTSNQHVLFHIVGEACKQSPEKEEGEGS